MIIWVRKKIEVPTDPQRRYYNGCWFSSKMVWSEWEALGYPKTKEDGESQIKDWFAWDRYAEKINNLKLEREYKLTDGVLP